MVRQPVQKEPERWPDRGEWSELLGSARTIFGEKLMRIILTGESDEKAPAIDVSVQGRASLIAAIEIAERLLGLEAKATVQAWFVGMNPLLDDRAPALVIRTDPDAVRIAARHFAAYG